MAERAFTEVSGPLAHVGVRIIDGAFSADLVERAISTMRNGRWQAASVLTDPRCGIDDGSHVDETQRRTKSVVVSLQMLSDYQDVFESLCEMIEAEHGDTVTSPSPPSFLRYAEGDYFQPHVDHSVGTNHPEMKYRNISCVVFLNEPDGESAYTGGSLLLVPFPEFGEHGLAIEPRAGRLVLFPSTMVHEVKPVESGERYTLVTWYHSQEIPAAVYKSDYVAPPSESDGSAY